MDTTKERSVKEKLQRIINRWLDAVTKRDADAEPDPITSPPYEHEDLEILLQEIERNVRDRNGGNIPGTASDAGFVRVPLDSDFDLSKAVVSEAGTIIPFIAWDKDGWAKPTAAPAITVAQAATVLAIHSVARRRERR